MQKWEYKRVLFAINRQGWYVCSEDGEDVFGEPDQHGTIDVKGANGFYGDGAHQGNIISDYLNGLGARGWEIISSQTFKVRRVEPEDIEHTYLLLKRPIEE